MTAALLLKNNFYLSIALIGARYFIGEVWKSPNITMIQDTVDPKKFGSIVSAYQFFYVIAGCLSTFTFGYLVNFLNCANNARMIGNILAGFCAFGYIGAAFSFWMAGRNYTAMIQNKKFSFC